MSLLTNLHHKFPQYLSNASNSEGNFFHEGSDKISKYLIMWHLKIRKYHSGKECTFISKLKTADLRKLQIKLTAPLSQSYLHMNYTDQCKPFI